LELHRWTDLAMAYNSAGKDLEQSPCSNGRVHCCRHLAAMTHKLLSPCSITGQCN